MSSNQGVLFLGKVNGESEWLKNDDEDTDGKYLGEIRNGVPEGQGTFTFSDGKSMKESGKMEKNMDRELTLCLMEPSMKESFMRDNPMDREQKPYLMDKSMSESFMRDNPMDREHTLGLVDKSMKESGKRGKEMDREL